ncbi:hypothetical protein [Halalkalicoccus ordinarius]|uniref:hypothetical protein n=1 Tax=Halalkalicoccus ordinarius TaxID=3116651 RepID=UPI00300EC1F9
MTDANERRTMREIDHTHPYDDRSAGDLFLRGPVVVADGGERNAVDAGGEENGVEPASGTMKDVDHTPPESEEGANRVFERGEEHGTEPVVGEE